jgi:hypothetical protein
MEGWERFTRQAPSRPPAKGKRPPAGLRAENCADGLQVEATAPVLLLLFLQCRAVTGFLHRSDELVGVSLAFFDLHDGLVWMCDLRADHSRGFFKCGPHFLYAIDLSDHSRNRQVHSFLCLRFGGLEVCVGRDFESPKGVSCCQHRHGGDEGCFKFSHAPRVHARRSPAIEFSRLETKALPRASHLRGIQGLNRISCGIECALRL